MMMNPSLSESDTRSKLIDPAIHARGWTEDLIRREETAGEITYDNNRPKRKKGRLDYTLRVRVNAETQPVALALIEAKREDHPPTRGLEQAKMYADCKRLNVSFVYSTNGHLFVEYDIFTGLTSTPRPMTEFPTPDELRARYEQGKGFKLTDAAASPLLQPYPGGESARRYYQDAAIRATLEHLALGNKRALLSLATGAGKTRIAVYLLRRLAEAGQVRKALFVCDRDELRTQANGAFQNVFGADAQMVTGGDPKKNARILIATYQTLDISGEDDTANFLINNYPENYFTHIFIDECHRSAWGKWSIVFKRNPEAVQIGLTATPRQVEISGTADEAKKDLAIAADNLKHFGEPVYEYTITQGIEDGYLAFCEVQQSTIDLDNTGITLEDVLARHPINANTGQAITREELQALYTAPTYEDRILLPDRVYAMTADLFNYLLATGGPEQKTIIFCARDRHCDDVAREMNNLYATWCAANEHEPLEHYAFKCTAAGGSEHLSNLRGASRSFFVACTVDLLTTGVDVPNVRNIAFFKYVNSPISFYQMVGRGTRLDPATDKLMFHVYDYTNASRLFGEEFLTRFAIRTGPKPEPPIDQPLPPPPIQVDGFEVHITPTSRSVLTREDGRDVLITIEEYRERLAARLVQEAPTLDAFRSRWVDLEQRRILLGQFTAANLSPIVVREMDEMSDYDLYDVLGELGYGLAPRTRFERAEAFKYKHADWLATLPPNTARTIKALAAQFARAGTDGLENPQVFQTPDVLRAGGLVALRALGQPADVLRDTKQRIFAA
ncbi:Putative DNA repair helicase RadD [Anaerolineales bacterium]|nr:Putative DNA repair helicase RadD [Anaerolineales bacterium]